jgi:acid phosphatase type 7
VRSFSQRSPTALWLLIVCAVAGLCCRPTVTVQPTSEITRSAFLVEPYLQVGNPGTDADHSCVLALLWHTTDGASPWTVDYRSAMRSTWQQTVQPTGRKIQVTGVEPHFVYQADLRNLDWGQSFTYRVRLREKVVFIAEGRAPKAQSQGFRFVAFGDCGAGTTAQRAIAHQAFQHRPDLVVITGDIVYNRGLVNEYRTNFWPIYNATEAQPDCGAPLLRSIPFIAAPGNHDIGSRDLGAYPSGLAYFLYWSQPLNGPTDNAGRILTPELVGPASSTHSFLAAAGENYPRMANFSFDYGNAHWAILDSNPYVDWSAPVLRAWLSRDLAAAQGHTWRFVAFHHPPFNSSKAHFQAQHMRLLADVFEAYKVDVVFSGHVHNYQRTYPLQFVADDHSLAHSRRGEHPIPGRWTLDRAFDGRTHTQPHGVIYVITGAGGNSLYNPEQQDDPDSWQPFTARFISKVHSLTVADAEGSSLTVRQLSTRGEELDYFVVTKAITIR